MEVKVSSLSARQW